jgi:TPR repeat protein
LVLLVSFGVCDDFEEYKKACNGGKALGCYNIGISYAKGQGVKQDKRIAKKYFRIACDLQDQMGCDNHKKLNEQGY